MAKVKEGICEMLNVKLLYCLTLITLLSTIIAYTLRGNAGPMCPVVVLHVISFER